MASETLIWEDFLTAFTDSHDSMVLSEKIDSICVLHVQLTPNMVRIGSKRGHPPESAGCKPEPPPPLLLPKLSLFPLLYASWNNKSVSSFVYQTKSATSNRKSHTQ
jgi:hypothetical protein